eukprot:3413413-Pleurochrysis_carterae.AAC.1
MQGVVAASTTPHGLTRGGSSSRGVLPCHRSAHFERPHTTASRVPTRGTVGGHGPPRSEVGSQESSRLERC